MTNFTEYKNLCIIPFVHISSKPDGRLRLCAKSPQEFSEPHLKKGFFLGRNTLNEIWNSKSLRDIRLKMLKGEKLDICSKCWKLEKVGRRSKRIKDNEKFLNKYKDRLLEAEKNHGFLSKKPVYLDLRLGNHCNLKCRTCNPLFSSLWYKELKKYEHENPLIPENVNFNTLNSMKEFKKDWYKTTVMHDMIEEISPDLELVYISGGEPFLIKEHEMFLDQFIKRGFQKNIQINLNTNLTYLNQSMLKKLSLFKKVLFMPSIDAYGKRNDWLRSPSRFSRIERNFKEILNLPENVEIIIHCTVSVFNVLYLHKLLEWLNDILKESSTQRQVHCVIETIFAPVEQHVSVLPRSLKKQAIKNLEKIRQNYKKLFFKDTIIGLINILKTSMEDTQETIQLRKQLKKEIQVIDKWRGENFFSVFPEFVNQL